MSKNIAINRLRDMLNWSDRLGSDERYEIESIINDLEVIE